MSIEYEVYTRSAEPIALDTLMSLCQASPPLTDFNDGPFAIRLLRNAKWDFSEFQVCANGVLMDNDIVSGCIAREEAEMDTVLRIGGAEAMRHFFDLSGPGGRGLAPIFINAEFDFASLHEGETVADVFGTDEPSVLNEVEHASTLYTVRSGGEGWFQTILAHVMAYHLRGLFFDPQSGDFRLYQ